MLDMFSSSLGGGGTTGFTTTDPFGGGSIRVNNTSSSGREPHQSEKDFSHQLAVELSEEEEELWRQLRRKRDFEVRLLDKRAQLSELRERRRHVSKSHAESLASVEYLKSELAFAQDQEREIEHDIAMLRESNRILQQAMQHQQGAGPIDPRELVADEKKRLSEAQLQHEQIAHLRSHLEKLRAEKAKLQQRQNVLFDKQRSAEQDRNRLLGTLQDDRSSINDVRQERIMLWEERTKLEKQMAEIVHGAQLASTGGALGSSSGVFASRTDPSANFGGVLDAVGGVRNNVTRDMPEVFQQSTSANLGPPRSGWAGFGQSNSTSPSLGGF
mmetsp:Transcript_88630/g.185220  ORF Transcript_88630/g.185220 Transcript_88630/m.185220 type:complete len:328 (-) Transcript_88630:350-1333(-)